VAAAPVAAMKVRRSIVAIRCLSRLMAGYTFGPVSATVPSRAERRCAALMHRRLTDEINEMKSTGHLLLPVVRLRAPS
jgi:hypothetical protein